MNRLGRWLLLGLLLLVPVAPLRAADDEEFRLDTHALRRILHDHELQALNRDDLIDDPRSTVVIFLGNSIDLSLLPGGLADFLERGGAVLIATDRSFSHPDLARVCNYAVANAYVRAWPPVQPVPGVRTWRVAQEAVYNEQPDCLIVQPTERVSPDVFYAHEFGLQTGKLRVSTNRSSYLMQAGRPRASLRVTPLAYLPPGAWYDDPRVIQPQPVALHTRHGEGELFLFADHSMFLNEMMLRSDLENFDLARNVVKQLQGSTNPRSKVLFVHDGTVVTKLDVPVEELRIPLRDVERFLVEKIDDAIQQIQAGHQQDDRLNDMTLEGFDKVPWLEGEGGFYFLLALVLAVGFVGYLVTRMVRATNTTDLTLPLFSRAQAKVAPLPSLLEHRYEGMKQDNNVGDVARAVVREWFAGLPGGRDEGPMPRVAYEGGWWARWTIARMVRRLWLLAQGIAPRRVSQERFQRTLREMEELARDVRKGRLRLEFTS